MLYISAQDFFEKASAQIRFSRQEELEAAAQMKAGDMAARDRIAASYLPVVAARIRRLPKDMQSTSFIYSCICALEREIDAFDFFQDSEPFMHRLGLVIQREVANHIAGM